MVGLLETIEKAGKRGTAEKDHGEMPKTVGRGPGTMMRHPEHHRATQHHQPLRECTGLRGTVGTRLREAAAAAVADVIEVQAILVAEMVMLVVAATEAASLAHDMQMQVSAFREIVGPDLIEVVAAAAAEVIEVQAIAVAEMTKSWQVVAVSEKARLAPTSLMQRRASR
jgi:hypothetical protein